MKLEFINSVRFVPNELVKMTDKSIIMTYIGIDRFILLSKNKDLNYAVFTIRDICDNANLSCKNRQQNCYVQKIKNHLKYFQDKGQIETLCKLCDYVKDMAIFVQNTGRLEEMHDLTHIKVNYPRKQAEHLAAVLLFGPPFMKSIPEGRGLPIKDISGLKCRPPTRPSNS